MDNPILPVAIGIIVALVVGFLQRSARRAHSEDSQSRNLVAYPRGFKIVALILGVAVMGVIVALFVKRQGHSIGFLIGFSLLFIALIIILLAEAFMVRITWDEKSIYAHSPWRKNREIPLSDVISCHYSP